jgi:hypothetical protein
VAKLHVQHNQLVVEPEQFACEGGTDRSCEGNYISQSTFLKLLDLESRVQLLGH